MSNEDVRKTSFGVQPYMRREFKYSADRIYRYVTYVVMVESQLVSMTSPRLLHQSPQAAKLSGGKTHRKQRNPLFICITSLCYRCTLSSVAVLAVESPDEDRLVLFKSTAQTEH